MKAQTKITKTRMSLGAALLLTMTSSHAALSVPVGNNLVVNDDVLNIAWTQDANLFKSQANSYSGGAAAFVTTVINTSGGFISSSSGPYNLTTGDFDTSTGTMSWWGAQAWVNYLNSTSYAGASDWRLPTIKPVNGSNHQWNVSFNGTTDRGFNSNTVNATASEMAHLFYNDLGNQALFTTTGVQQSSGYGLVNSGPFSNLTNAPYWSGTEYFIPEPNSAWLFSFGHGGQGTSGTESSVQYYGIAVHAVPEPVTGVLWLMGSAVVGLRGRMRRNATL